MELKPFVAHDST